MSNDPHSYRVPVLRVGNIFDEEKQDKNDPFGDSVVTGLDWTVGGVGDNTEVNIASKNPQPQHTDQQVLGHSLLDNALPVSHTHPTAHPVEEICAAPQTNTPADTRPTPTPVPVPPSPGTPTTTPPQISITPTSNPASLDLQRTTIASEIASGQKAKAVPTDGMATVPASPTHGAGIGASRSTVDEEVTLPHQNIPASTSSLGHQAPHRAETTATPSTPLPDTARARTPVTQPVINTPTAHSAPPQATASAAPTVPTENTSTEQQRLLPTETQISSNPVSSARQRAGVTPALVVDEALEKNDTEHAILPDVWADVDPKPKHPVPHAMLHEPGFTTHTPEAVRTAEPSPTPDSTAHVALSPEPPAPTVEIHTKEHIEAPSIQSVIPTLDNPGEEPPDLWEKAAQTTTLTPATSTERERKPEAVSPPTTQAQQTTPTTTEQGTVLPPRAEAYQAQQTSNLEALRNRAHVAQDTAAPQALQRNASTARRSELARTNVQALQQGLDLLRTIPDDQAGAAPHAQAIAEVAQKLRTLRGDVQESGVGSPSTSQAETYANTSSVTPALMRTFKQDVERSVGNHPTSIVQMVAAQEDARAAQGASTPKPVGFSPGLYILLTMSMLLVLGAAGIVAILLTNGFFDRENENMIQPSNTITYNLNNQTRSEIMRDLVLIRDDANLSIGEILNISLTETVFDRTAEKDIARAVDARTVFEHIGARLPDTLVRSVERPIIVGLVETEAGTAPFIILQVQSYEFALSSMFEWEPALSADLHPFFPNQPIPDEVTARTLTETPFIDRTVANIPSRVLETDERDVVLLWSIPDDRLVITTNERAFRLLWERLRL